MASTKATKALTPAVAGLAGLAQSSSSSTSAESSDGRSALGSRAESELAKANTVRWRPPAAKKRRGKGGEDPKGRANSSALPIQSKAQLGLARSSASAARRRRGREFRGSGQSLLAAIAAVASVEKAGFRARPIGQPPQGPRTGRLARDFERGREPGVHTLVFRHLRSCKRIKASTPFTGSRIPFAKLGSSTSLRGECILSFGRFSLNTD